MDIVKALLTLPAGARPLAGYFFGGDDVRADVPSGDSRLTKAATEVQASTSTSAAGHPDHQRI